MATLLITVPAVTSHILPMLPTAEALVKRGHRVLVHTAQHHFDKVQAAGAELIPMPEHCDIVYRLENSSVRVPSWLPKFLSQVWYFRNEVLAMIPVMVAELETIIKREQVDCLIGDYLGFGASYAAERLCIPYVTLTMSWALTPNADAIPLFLSLPLPSRAVHAIADFIFPLRRIRNQIGLPQRPKNTPAEFFAVIVSNLLNLVTIHQEFIPPKQLQKNQVFIGPTAFETPRTNDNQPFGASLAPGTVLVSSTTSPKSDDGLFRRLVESLAQTGIPILALSGSATDIPSGLGENVRLEKFVPFDEVLPYVSAIVTSGGFGTVGRAFRIGIPMLIIPDLEGDTLFTAIRAEELGLAYHLPKSKTTPKVIQSKLKALLEDHALHARLKDLSLKLRLMNAPELAANAIEDILQNSQTTKKVLRATYTMP
ncbi:glycosyltransferase family 1 protein [Nostoc sp. FACHB-892]|uniref:glycosyltransferase n=1 Tax=Nostoc sp. FACHB-892 TaxID=2692843 RepID=UPI00168327CF|nr:glycosyltransferase [Nostoc sp. FACHB-892]MBD2726601.1 glycosyltransferase family 1 protein [Nostoc sp. FACHB-892]